MGTSGNGRRDIDPVIVTALALGSTYGEAAGAAGISRTTVARRMKEPRFRARVAEEREQVVEGARGRLAASAPAAAETIADLAVNASGETARLAAATRILDYALRRKAGFDTFDSAEVGAMVRALVEVSLAHIPKEAHATYLNEVRGLGAPR